MTTDVSFMVKKSQRSPLCAIRRNCRECCGGVAQEVSLCTSKRCPLWPFRFGISPLTAQKQGRSVNPFVDSPAS